MDEEVKACDSYYDESGDKRLIGCNESIAEGTIRLDEGVKRPKIENQSH